MRYVLLVREIPTHNPAVAPIRLREVLDQPDLRPEHLRVRVGVAPASPRHVPVLAAHVPTEERGDDPHPCLIRHDQEFVEPTDHGLIDDLGRESCCKNFLILLL